MANVFVWRHVAINGGYYIEAKCINDFVLSILPETDTRKGHYCTSGARTRD